MIESVEGVGEAVTGGLIAKAVEPGTGEAAEAHGACLNCGAELVGAYCHRCGQTGHIHRTLSAFGHDIAHSVLHFDGKIWRTLPLLAWRPGELTRRYVEGERAKFVSPMALFLFSVFLMFAVFSTLGGPFALDQAHVDAASAQELQAERRGTERKIAALEAERATIAAAGKSTAAVDANIADLKKELAILSAAGTLVGSPGRDAGADSSVLGPGNIRADTGWPTLDKAIEKAGTNPSLLLYKLQTNAYKFSWALIPISVPFVWLLLFWKRRYRVYDHVVFVTYSIAFMSLGVIALSLIRPLGLGEDFAELAILLVPPIHMYRQLRGAYALSRPSALWRTVLLVNFAFVAGGLFFSLLLGLGAMA